MNNEDLIAEARTPHCKECDHFMRAMADALEATNFDLDGHRRLLSDAEDRLREAERSLERYKRMNPKRAVTKLREAETLLHELTKGLERFEAVPYYAEAREILGRWEES